MFVFVVVPIFVALYISFTSYSIITPPRWIGWWNYLDLLEDPLFWRSIINTAYFTGVTVPAGVALSLALAIFINRQLQGVGFFRSVYYAPVIMPMVAAALIWNMFYDPNIGLFNYIREQFGLAPIRWLNSTQWAMPSVILMSIWKSFGFNMVIFLAGLQSIPKELYEAAEIDGATRLRVFWGITLPLLKMSMLYVIITSTIGAFQVFSQVYVMTGGGPSNSTTTIVHQIYRTAFVHLDMGYASAMAFVLFLFLGILSAINMKLFGGKNPYN
jgi:multiple sugar transport system permease protein